MVADLGTRRGATIEDVLPNSKWQKGSPWMTKDVAEFPAVKYTDITLSDEDKKHVGQEVILFQGFSCRTEQLSNPVPEEVADRYKFSNYIIDR